MIATLVAAIVAASSTAHGEVDWSKGLVTANGLGVADRLAPSPAAAREPARRAAETQAKKQLAAQLPALPLAGGGTLKAKLADKAIADRVAAAVANAITVEATPQTDGSWTVTLAVPIEAVRLAIAGPRPVNAPDADAPVIVVEGVTAKPAVGTVVNKMAAATLWVKDLPAWAADAPRVKATKSSTAAIEIGAVTGKPAGPATLFVILQ